METKTLRNILILSITSYLIYCLKNVLTPFLIALFIAYLINPFIVFIELKLKLKRRGLSVFIGLSSILIFFTLLILASSPFVNAEFRSATILLKEYSELPPLISAELNQKISQFIESDAAKNLINSNTISETVNQITPLIKNLFSESLDFIFRVIGVFLILIYLIFILIGYPKLKESWLKWIPISHKNTAQDISRDLNNGMRAYFRGQALIACIVGVLFCLGFKIIGLPLAILLGLSIGCLNLVPYMQLIGFIPAFALSLLHSIENDQSLWASLGATLLIFIIVQLIQELLLVPKIMNQVTGLHPAIILLSLSIWGSLLGLTGLIIALPITTLLISYYKRYISNLAD